MLLDHKISKPASLSAYQLHQLVQGLTDGESPPFADHGDHVIIRTEKPVTPNPTPVRAVAAGDIVAFELRCCVGKKVGGKHRYFPLRDWRSRHYWLARQGKRHGFEPLTVNCRAGRAEINDGKDRRFTVDQSDFVGVLKVTDPVRFQHALATGIGATAKTYGFGLMQI